MSESSSPIATLDERDFLGLAGVLRLHLKRCGSLESTGEHDTLLRAADALESFANPSTIQAAGWIPGDEQALEADRAMTKALAYSDCISACEAVIADYSAHKNADGFCTGPDFNFGEIEAVGRAIERIRSEAQMRTPSATAFHKVAKIERGFVYLPEKGGHEPTVTVSFALDDWESRDRFANSMRNAAPQESDSSAGNNSAAPAVAAPSSPPDKSRRLA